MLAATINLTPDQSILPLLGIFLIVMLILHFCIFRPVLRIIDARGARTDGELDRARELERATDSLDRSMQDELEAVRKEGIQNRQKKRDKILKKANRILEEGKRESEEIMERGSAERERMRQQFKKEMESQIPEISQLITNHAMLTEEDK